MADYIDREELLKTIEEGVGDTYAYQDGIVDLINELPTVEQKHGHWYIDEQKNIWGDYVNCQVCSVCNKRNIDCYKKSDYCPNCGAKMDEVTE